MRFYAAAEHIHKGQQLRDTGSLSRKPWPNSVSPRKSIPPTSRPSANCVHATEEIQRQEREKENAKKNNGQPTTLEKEAKSAAGPVALDIKWDTPISLHLTSTTVDVVYKTIAKIAGINVLIDPDYKPQKINFELQDVRSPPGDGDDCHAVQDLLAPGLDQYHHGGRRHRLQAQGTRAERHEDVLSQECRLAGRSAAGRRNAQGHSRYQPRPGHARAALAHPSRHARPDGSCSETAHRHRQAQSRGYRRRSA